MSDYIPVEILAEIFKRVPVKSLIRFRSVSKPWKSLIESLEFVNSYHICQTQEPQHRIYVQDRVDGEQEYFSYIDDHTFPIQKRSFLTAPLPLILLGHPSPLSCVSRLEVFKFSTCVWKTVSSIPLAFRSCDLTWEGQSDEFGEVCLPDRLVHTYDLRVTKVKDSLGLLEDYDDGEIPFCGVWILNDGVTKSFAKMFSVKLQSEWIGPIAILDFTKDGKAIRLKYVDDDYMLSCVLSAYEENGKGVGIPVRVTLFAAKSYMETILLLDQSNSFVY
ncbi:F-box domain containing protein [Tanacetum coccineum]